jgi:16S rRNA (uracil1498-N3)-methyltransferase
MLYERASGWSPPTEHPAAILLCIGPEGGWHPGEVEAAVGEGFRTVGLGPRILRVETAAIAAVALIQFSGAPVSNRE